MKRIAISLVACAAAALASAQKPESKVDEVWKAASIRMYNQHDQWFQDGEYPACIQLLKFEAAKFPHDEDIWTNLGWMQENIQQWDGALDTYKRFLKANPQDPDAALPEALYFDRKKDYAKVPALLEPEIKRQCHPDNFRILARSYEKMKQYKSSIRVWQTYLKRAPDDGAAKMNLARVEKKLAAKT